MCGVMFPILVFRSPHNTVLCWGCICAMIDSTSCSTCSSSSYLRASDVAGGIYAVTRLSLLLSGSIIRAYIAYSLDLEASMCSYERTYTAIPPLWPLSLLCSMS
jgi:hypothetical protein